MARHKNIDWTLPDGRMETWEQVQVAILMDIRDELKRLNAAIYCPNFLDVPRKLDRIARNTEKKARKQ